MIRTLVFAFSVLLFASPGLAQDLDRMYIDTESSHSAMILTDGTNIVVDWITQTVTIEKPGSATFNFTIDEVVNHAEPDPQLQDQLYQDVGSALNEPAGSIVYLPQRDPNLGLTGGGGDSGGGGSLPSPVIRSARDSKDAPSKDEGSGLRYGGYGDICYFMLDGTHECMPVDEASDFTDNQFRYSNRGNGHGSIFGRTTAARDCAMAHYRDWLGSQGQICQDAVAAQGVALGAGAAALGACRQFSMAPSGPGGLICAGAYLGLLSSAWFANRGVNACMATYPGPGFSC